MLRLTRKASLIAARTALPSSLEDVKEGAILPGFIASATPVGGSARAHEPTTKDILDEMFMCACERQVLCKCHASRC